MTDTDLSHTDVKLINRAQESQVLEAVRQGFKHARNIAAQCALSARVVDNALKRLCAAGRIRYTGQKTGWVIT